ncbi:MAG: ATP-dependent helicase [Nitrospinota bacterium]
MNPPRRYPLVSSAKPARSRIDYEADLNPQQLEVVTASGGPMLVIAGAGSGKTRTVTYRMAGLIERGENPARILLLTFTNKAAHEMLRRAQGLVRIDVRRVWGGTFHHVGNLILRRHAKWVGRGENYSILDREDSADLLDTCTADVGINPKERFFPKGGVLRDILSFALNTDASVEEVVCRRYCGFEDSLPDIQGVLERFARRKTEMNVLDFDDLLVLWLRLLQEHPEARKRYQGQFRHVLVDEYQDINRLQGRLIDLLAGEHRNLMVVGDDAQSIYSFRGAEFANILEFPQRYPDARVYRLEINYRSAPEILRLANESIAHNTRQFQKKLRTEQPPGELPVVVPVRDALQQADFVCQRILELQDEGVPLDEFGVLYRAHFHSMELQMELTRRGVPFQVRSGLRFFEQRHVKDSTAYLKVIVNPRDEIAWKRILLLLSGVGNVTAHRFWQAIAAAADPLDRLESPKFASLFPKRAKAQWRKLADTLKGIRGEALSSQPAEMIRLVVERGYRDYLRQNFTNATSRLEDLEQLARFAEQFASVERFLSDLALLTSVGGEDMEGDVEPGASVVLSSVHQAKGLEWRRVFVIWLAEDRFPSALALREEEDDEEERRLFYVAVTRAKEGLYLCYPLMELGRYQTGVFTKPSRFIEELPEASYERWAIEEDFALHPAEPWQEGAAQGVDADDWDQSLGQPGPQGFSGKGAV